MSAIPAAAGGFNHPAPTVHIRDAYHNQNDPYAVKATMPNVLPLAYSRTPAINWESPPNENAKGTTAATASAGRKPALMQLKTAVVNPKAASPSGAGLAIFGVTAGIIAGLSVESI